MAQLVVSEFMALNGVIESPEKWSMQFFNDEISQLKLTEILEAEAMLLGRTTYDAFAAAWPSRSGDAFSDKINQMPKYVVSSRPETNWGPATVLTGNPAESVAELKGSIKGTLLVNGSAALVQALVAAGLVDQFTLLTYPVVRPESVRLFAPGTGADLTLTNSRAFDNGVVLLTYARR